MKKYARILIAVTFLLGLGVAAKAEDFGWDHCQIPLPVCGWRKNPPCRHIQSESFGG